MATRNRKNVLMGVSTRGSLALLRAAKAYAFLQGQPYVAPDDVKAVASAVLSHRIILQYNLGKEADNRALMERILDGIPVPTEE